jgi:hypothetical protein
MPMTGKKYSSAIFSSKKAIVNVYPGGDSPCGVEDSKRPKRVNIEEADGGFIINKSGGSLGYNDRPVVAESLEKALGEAKTYLNSSEKEED